MNNAQPFPDPAHTGPAIEITPEELAQLDRIPADWRPKALRLMRQLQALTGIPTWTIPLESNGNLPERALHNMELTVAGLAAMPPRKRRAFLKRLEKPKAKAAHKRR